MKTFYDRTSWMSSVHEHHLLMKILILLWPFWSWNSVWIRTVVFSFYFCAFRAVIIHVDRKWVAMETYNHVRLFSGTAVIMTHVQQPGGGWWSASKGARSWGGLAAVGAFESGLSESWPAVWPAGREASFLPLTPPSSRGGAHVQSHANVLQRRASWETERVFIEQQLDLQHTSTISHLSAAPADGSQLQCSRSFQLHLRLLRSCD